MKSIKTGIVVVVMLVVVYGVWQMINNKPLAPPQGVSDMMSQNFPEVNFAAQGTDGGMTPPVVQAPGVGAPGVAESPAAGGTMPELRAPQPLAGSGLQSPYANGQPGAHHAGHDHGNTNPAGPSAVGHGQRDTHPGAGCTGQSGPRLRR